MPFQKFSIEFLPSVVILRHAKLPQFRKLLCDAAAALIETEGLRVMRYRAGDAIPIDAGVLEKIPVFHCEKCRNEVRGKFVERPN